MKRKTNFDRYLEKQLKDPDFACCYQKAGEAWDVALQLAALRKKAGLSQKELAQRVGTSQQQISRLESTSYEGHSLSMLRRVAEVLGAKVHIDIQLLKRKDKGENQEIPGLPYRKGVHETHVGRGGGVGWLTTNHTKITPKN